MSKLLIGYITRFFGYELHTFSPFSCTFLDKVVLCLTVPPYHGSQYHPLLFFSYPGWYSASLFHHITVLSTTLCSFSLTQGGTQLHSSAILRLSVPPSALFPLLRVVLSFTFPPYHGSQYHLRLHSSFLGWYSACPRVHIP